MNCQYCNQPCREATYNYQIYNCHFCNARYYAINNQIKSIELYHRVNERTYTVTFILDPKDKTTIHYTEPYPPQHTYGGFEPDIYELLLESDNILPITPENFLDKLKLYMTFS